MLPILMIIDSLDDEKQKKFIEKLYHNYSAWILKEAYLYVEDYDAAQDVLNETFVKLIRHVETVQELEDYKVTSYIKHTVHSAAMNYLNRENKERKKIDRWIEHNEPIMETEIDFEELIHRSDIRNLLINCMNQMTERDRKLIIFKYGYHMNYKEISKYFGLSSDCAASYVRRAKRKFRIILRREIGDE